MTFVDINTKLAVREALKMQIKRLEAEVNALEADVKDEMKREGVDELRTGYFVVNWKTTNRTILDSKKLKATEPDVWTKYSKASATTTFTVTRDTAAEEGAEVV